MAVLDGILSWMNPIDKAQLECCLIASIKIEAGFSPIILGSTFRLLFYVLCLLQNTFNLCPPTF